MTKSHHVVPNPNGGWDIKTGDGSKSIQHFQTKQPAVERAREISRKQETELFIHGKNGRIQSRDSHGNDPFPPNEVSVDPFYSESNMAAIDEAAKQIEHGRVVVKTIEELKAMENE